jgi:Homeobox KN domain
VTGLSSQQIKNWFINARKRCPIKERTTQRSETTSRKRHKNGLPNKSIERLARDQRSSLRKHMNSLSSEFEVFSFGTKSRKKTKQTSPEIAIPLPLKPKERNYLFGDLFSMKKTYNQQLIRADYQRSEIGFSDHNHTKLLSYEPTS